MTTWRREQGRDRASDHTLAILPDIEVDLAISPNTYPQLASIRIGAQIPHNHDFEVEMTIAPGVPLFVRYQSVDDEDRGRNKLEDDRGSVAGFVVQAVKDLQAEGVSMIADWFHNLHIRTRKMLAAWQAEAAHLQLIDTRTVWNDYTFNAQDAVVEVRLTGLDDQLRPYVDIVELSIKDSIETEFARWRSYLQAPFKSQAALAQEGADGMIDLLAINALYQFGDVQAAVRKMRTEQSSCHGLKNLTIFADNGHIQCSGHDAANPTFTLNRDTVTIHNQTLPKSALAVLPGRPIADLIEHPVLSEDMVITEVVNNFEYDRSSNYAKFAQPRQFFCGISGRMWPCSGTEA